METIAKTANTGKEANAGKTVEVEVESTESSKDPLETRIERLTKAHESVKNYTMASVAVGFIPVPLVDIAALTAIQLKMLNTIAKDYDVPFSKNIVKSLLSSLVGSSVAVTAAIPFGSWFKVVPIIGQTSGMISIALIGSASTYAVGKIFVGHFESGGTFLDFNIEKAKVHFKELYEEGKAFVSMSRAAETNN